MPGRMMPQRRRLSYQATVGHRVAIRAKAVPLLPAYAPELNPAEGAWANMKNDLGNLAACTVDQLAGTVRNQLQRIQRRPDLVTGFLAQTGLTLEPGPP